MIIFWFENLNRKIHKKKQLLAKFNSFFFRNKFIDPNPDSCCCFSSSSSSSSSSSFCLLQHFSYLSFSCIRTTINLSLFLSVFLSFFLSFFLSDSFCTTTVIGSLHMRPLHQPRPQPRSRLFHNRWVRQSRQVPQLYSSLSPKSFGTVLGSSPTHKLCGCMEKMLVRLYIYI